MDLPSDVILFLITKVPVALRGATCDMMVERADPRRWRARGTAPVVPRGTVQRCGRPVWGNGEISGVPHGMCSACWHNSQMFRGGGYLLFRANAAAENLADLSGALRRLGVGAAQAPEPDAVFDPWEWEQREQWDEDAAA